MRTWSSIRPCSITTAAAICSTTATTTGEPESATPLRRISRGDLQAMRSRMGLPSRASWIGEPGLTIDRGLPMSDVSDDSEHIPFNHPYTMGRELATIADAVAQGHIAADGQYSHLCRLALQEMLGAPETLVLHSCSAALELSALL